MKGKRCEGFAERKARGGSLSGDVLSGRSRRLWCNTGGRDLIMNPLNLDSGYAATTSSVNSMGLSGIYRWREDSLVLGDWLGGPMGCLRASRLLV